MKPASRIRFFLIRFLLAFALLLTSFQGPALANGGWGRPYSIMTFFGSLSSSYSPLIIVPGLAAAMYIEYVLFRWILGDRLPVGKQRRAFLWANGIGWPITFAVSFCFGPLAEVIPLVFESILYSHHLDLPWSQGRLIGFVALINLVSFAVGAGVLEIGIRI